MLLSLDHMLKWSDPQLRRVSVASSGEKPEQNKDSWVNGSCLMKIWLIISWIVVMKPSESAVWAVIHHYLLHTYITTSACWTQSEIWSVYGRLRAVPCWWWAQHWVGNSNIQQAAHKQETSPRQVLTLQFFIFLVRDSKQLQQLAEPELNLSLHLLTSPAGYMWHVQGEVRGMGGSLWLVQWL